MKIVLEIKLPVGVSELAAISDGLAEIHKAHELFMQQEGPMLQIFYEDAGLPIEASRRRVIIC